MRTVRIVTSAAEMEDLQSYWDELHVAGRHTIFQSYSWNKVAAKIFSQREGAIVVFAESDSGMAIIPACFAPAATKISLLGETLFDYRDVLHVGDEALLSTAWEALAAEATRYDANFEAVALRESPEAVGRWAGFELHPFANAPFISRDASSAQHGRLSRNMRRLSRAGVQMRHYDGSAISLLKRIYQMKATEPDSLFQDPLRIKCILALAESEPNACEIFTLEDGSTIVAALVTFLDGDCRRFYTTYFDDNWAKHSPGLTVLHEIAQQTLASGLNCDFLTGEQPYKRRLATSAVPLYRVSASSEMLRDLADRKHVVLAA